MKLSAIVFAAVLTLGLSAIAAETSGTATAEKSTTEAPAKKVRKKKAMMCGECGKPEAECECDHSKDEKKEEKK